MTTKAKKKIADWFFVMMILIVVSCTVMCVVSVIDAVKWGKNTTSAVKPKQASSRECEFDTHYEKYGLQQCYDVRKDCSTPIAKLPQPTSLQSEWIACCAIHKPIKECICTAHQINIQETFRCPSVIK